MIEGRHGLPTQNQERGQKCWRPVLESNPHRIEPVIEQDYSFNLLHAYGLSS